MGTGVTGARRSSNPGRAGCGAARSDKEAGSRRRTRTLGPTCTTPRWRRGDEKSAERADLDRAQRFDSPMNSPTDLFRARRVRLRSPTQRGRCLGDDDEGIAACTVETEILPKPVTRVSSCTCRWPGVALLGCGYRLDVLQVVSETEASSVEPGHRADDEQSEVLVSHVLVSYQ